MYLSGKKRLAGRVNNATNNIHMNFLDLFTSCQVLLQLRMSLLDYQMHCQILKIIISATEVAKEESHEAENKTNRDTKRDFSKSVS